MSEKIDRALDDIKQNFVVSDSVNQGMSRQEQLDFARRLLQGSSSVKDERCGEFKKQFGDLEISFETDGGQKVVTDIVNKTSGKDLYDTPEQLYQARRESSNINQHHAMVGIDDRSTVALCKATTAEEKNTAGKVLEDLLNGKDVSAQLNSSPTSARDILAVVKQDLLQLSQGAGGKVGTENTEGLATDFERSRFIDFTTVKGEKVAIEEDQFGVIKDMKVNIAVLPFNLIPWYRSTVDVYDRVGEAEARAQQEKAQHPNRGLLEIMAGKPLDGTIIIEKAAERSQEDVNGYGK